MKRIFIVMVAIIALISCSKDDNEIAVNEVAGKWVQTYYKNSLLWVGQEDGTYLQLNTDGTFTFLYSGWGDVNRITTGKYSIIGSPSLPAYLEIEYDNGKKGSISISSIEQDGNAVLFIDGLSAFNP